MQTIQATSTPWNLSPRLSKMEEYPMRISLMRRCCSIGGSWSIPPGISWVSIASLDSSIPCLCPNSTCCTGTSSMMSLSPFSWSLTLNWLRPANTATLRFTLRAMSARFWPLRLWMQFRSYRKSIPLLTWGLGASPQFGRPKASASNVREERDITANLTFPCPKCSPWRKR